MSDKQRKKREEQDWRDVEDTARRCGVTKAAVYRWIKDEKVRVKTSSHHRAGRYLIDQATVPAGGDP